MLFSNTLPPSTDTAISNDLAQVLFQEIANTISRTSGLAPGYADLLLMATGAVCVVLLASIATWGTRLLAVRMIALATRKNTLAWNTLLSDSFLLQRLSRFAAILVYTRLGYFVFCKKPELYDLLNTIVSIYTIWLAASILLSLLDLARRVATARGHAARMPVHGVSQAIKLVVWLIGSILILSTLLNKSPVYFLSGIGALSAVLLLIFKDALLGLVAGVMLSANRMVVSGDWIEMPKYDVDGEVVEVSLTTVKVRNWDMTIVTVPAYSLIGESLKNWRGMTDSGGRRIKRAICIDMQTIRFADDALLAHWGKIDLLKKYLAQKKEQIEKENRSLNDKNNELATGDTTLAPFNKRRLTNIGTFRAYCLAYLRKHPGVHQEMTLLVRQLSPNEHGLPLELYFFTNNTSWSIYEDTQSDIFDHLLAIISEFDLAVYQTPSSTDQRFFAKLIAKN
ncbi:MAG: mechanosensitive ion channel family protein [Puniceicoccales bacterium]|jgi:miniconductance mechanosensitive channel|nr:mechanosensitive ion channel family protein [Puniceicoccales bacterium]